MTSPKITRAGSAAPLRVLYSFPLRVGAGQICHIAWQQVIGLREAGVDVVLAAGSLRRSLPDDLVVRKTLSVGKLRVPIRLLGRQKACRLHDWLVSKMLPELQGEIDLVHGWPLASLLTIRAAKKLGIPVVIERPNAHTRFAFEVVERECRKIGFTLPSNHDHAFNELTLAREEAEYDEADALLCPSDFVARTFRDRGFPTEKLLRHQYGYDESRFFPNQEKSVPSAEGLTMLYAGTCDPRKGLHHALRAWLDSGASESGRFLIAGTFATGYRERLADLLKHPSVDVLGQRPDIDEFMRKSDLFVLPSVEEGSALVTYEARASGCVLVVSDSSGAPCRHMHNGLVHRTGDVAELSTQIRLLDRDRALLARLKERSIEERSALSWKSAGNSLASAYLRTMAGVGKKGCPPMPLVVESCRK